MNLHKPVPTIYGYFGEKYGAIWEKLTTDLQAEFGESIQEILKPGEAMTDLPTYIVKKSATMQILEALKKNHKFDFLTDYTATDEVDAGLDFRFYLVIHLMSTETKARIRLKIKLAENETMPTLIPLWGGANWAEREIYDMFGIHFEGHPDLRRILMDMRWEGHPLRKDYPLRGYQVFLTPEPIDPELLK
jgi:NADH/F420H2 dehydrogenase subunit C